MDEVHYVITGHSIMHERQSLGIGASGGILLWGLCTRRVTSELTMLEAVMLVGITGEVSNGVS